MPNPYGRVVHGKRHIPGYRSWVDMRRRCLSPKDRKYYLYGGRGILICDRWINSVVNFLEDMGPCPPGHTLDRKDSELNYTPDNCQWATTEQQSINRRKTLFLKTSTRYIPFLVVLQGAPMDRNKLVRHLAKAHLLYRRENGLYVEHELPPTYQRKFYKKPVLPGKS